VPGGFSAEREVSSMYDDDDLERLVGPMTELLEALKELAACLEGSAPPPAATDEWDSFLGEHPELAWEPLRFDDAELVAAVAEAERQWIARQGDPEFRGTYASDVALVLRGFPILGHGATKGDAIRVGRALARLGRDGRLVPANRSWETKRWTVAGACDAN
jgi:hypothetical protein